MKYSNVYIASLGYELPEEVMTTAEIERRLEPAYKSFHFKMGMLENMTGIKERRYWPVEHTMHEGTGKAVQNVLNHSNISPHEIEMLVYCGVCRDNMEPATACVIAERAGISSNAQIFDISNAC